MTQINQVYKCNVCGNIVEVLHTGGGALVCCQEPMQLLIENTVDVAKEKHVPVIEKTESGVKVKIGVEPHPMTAEHYIEWIEIIIDPSGDRAGGRTCKHFLKPGEAPEAEFKAKSDNIIARAYCNLHELWQSQ